MLKILTNLKDTFYEDKEMQDIMNEFYLIKKNNLNQGFTDVVFHGNCDVVFHDDGRDEFFISVEEKGDVLCRDN